MDDLLQFRERIDALDNRLIEIIAARLVVCREVAEFKKGRGIAMMQPARVLEVKRRNAQRGAGLGLDPNFVEALYDKIIGEACRLEDEIIGVSLSNEAK